MLLGNGKLLRRARRGRSRRSFSPWEQCPEHQGTSLGHLQRRGWAQGLLRSEVSQRETNESPILVHKCGTWKNGAAETVCRAEIETQTQRTDARTWEEGDGTSRESGVDTCPPPRGGWSAGGQCLRSSELSRGLCGQLEAWGQGLGRRSERGGICVHTELIHAEQRTRASTAEQSYSKKKKSSL